MTDTNETEPAHIRAARFLGADAALAAASWVGMSESDAASILSDVDPAVVDNYREPNLSGEFADDPTPVSVAHDVGANDGDIAFYGAELLTDIADAWESGRDAVWSDALQGIALRTLGRIADAERVERACEETVRAYRLATEPAPETDPETIAVTAAIAEPFTSTPRTTRGRDRRAQALAYLWGREDAGDRAARDALVRIGATVSPDAAFSAYAANAADAYDREERTSLESISGQYETFLRVLSAMPATES